MEDEKAFLETLPSSPGVYRMLNDSGKILYVGKAKNLKKRVSSYFRTSYTDKKTEALMAHVDSVEFTIVNNEHEALLLENNFIKQYRPRYNVVLRDDKTYPFLLLSTEHDFPRLDLYRGKGRPKGQTFGPFPNAGSVRESLSLIQKLFRLRQCNDVFFSHRSRPCLQYQIHRCTAPCVGYVSKKDYADQVRLATLFLKGENNLIIDSLTHQMTEASDLKAYERAQYFRDTVIKLRLLQKQQTIVGGKSDVDVLAVVQSLEMTAVCIVFIRSGRVLGHKTYFPSIPAGFSPSDAIHAFIAQYYCDSVRAKQNLAKVIVNVKINQREALQRSLQKLFGTSFRLTDRQLVMYQAWRSMAEKNALHDIAQRLSDSLTPIKQLHALQDALSLPDSLSRIECFDVSHTQGTSTVASCVVYTTAGITTSEYRRFTIKDITPGDDYAAMRQVLLRRYTQVKKDDAPLPDLVIIDGGKGQMSQAISVMLELQLTEIPLLGVAKGESRKAGEETLFLNDVSQSIELSSESVALHLIQLIRDESHRFAIAGHRSKRKKQFIHSPLDDIEGIGPKRRQALLRHFGGMQGLLQASQHEIAAVQGVSSKLAELIYCALHP
ncbi:MAG: excinuclease ABC subunit C [Coxiellaceae bacterium]|nr:excinuclease ABC subunit C [Coxiellaceae bacterium]|tara:strand:+ start:810 stop:2627 length:1818 start_codon:yes stop_codon:yes gene_type:complete